MSSVSLDGLVYTVKSRQGDAFQDNPCFPDGNGRVLKAAIQYVVLVEKNSKLKYVNVKSCNRSGYSSERIRNIYEKSNRKRTTTRRFFNSTQSELDPIRTRQKKFVDQYRNPNPIKTYQKNQNSTRSQSPAGDYLQSNRNPSQKRKKKLLTEILSEMDTLQSEIKKTPLKKSIF